MVNFLQLIATDRPPFLDGMAEMARQEIIQGIHNDPPNPPLLLNRSRRFLGNLWLPSYLPDGFELERAEVTNPTREHPDLLFPNNRADEDGYGFIVLTVDPAELHTHEYVSSDLEAHVASVEVGGKEGVVIRGGWLTVLSEEGVVHFNGWDSEHTCKLILKDPTYDQIITLEARPASIMSEEELLRVAESLQSSRVRKFWLPWLQRG